MIQKRFISISIRRLTFSLLLLMAAVTASAQVKFFSFQKDSIPTFRGFAVSFDLVGAGLMQFSDNGQYEGALRVNLHDEDCILDSAMPLHLIRWIYLDPITLIPSGNGIRAMESKTWRVISIGLRP